MDKGHSRLPLPPDNKIMFNVGPPYSAFFPYYPVNDQRNNWLYAQYKEKAQREAKVIFGGRLGSYQYYDMDKVIGAALEWCKELL